MVEAANGPGKQPVNVWLVLGKAISRRLRPKRGFPPTTQAEAADKSGTTWFRSPWSRYLGGRGSLRGLAGRALALLAVLSVAKAGVVAALERHLFQTHWRLRPEHPTAFDHANFLFFVGLVTVSLVELGREAGRYSTRQIRGVNLGLATAGSLFVFFSLEKMQKNYLQPVAEGILSFSDLRYYLALDLFFAPPYLAVYLAVYALGYWVLWRARREAWTLHLQAGLWTVYAVINLHNLAGSRTQLGMINCVGVASLAGWWLSRARLGGWWVLLPAVLIAPVWIFFANHEPAVAHPGPVFVLLAALAVSVLVLGFVLTRRSRSLVVVSHFLVFYFLALFILSSRNMPLADNYSHLLAYGLTAPRYFLPTLLLCAGLFAACALLARWRPRMGVVCFDAMAVGIALVALVDLGLVRRMGVRLDWNVLTMSDDTGRLWDTIRPFASHALVALLITIVIYGLCAWRFSSWLRRFPAAAIPAAVRSSAGPLGALALLGLAGMALVPRDKAVGTCIGHLLASSPWFHHTQVERYSREEFFRRAHQLGFDWNDSRPVVGTSPASAPADLNVVLVVMESSYNRYLSLFGSADETQPLLKRYRDRMELFPNFISNFPNSFHARFQLFNSLLAAKPYVSYVNPRIEAPSIFEILHDRGYTTSFYYSSSRDYTRMADYLGHRKIDHFHDCDDMPGAANCRRVTWGIEEEATLNAMKLRLAAHAQGGERFFLTYVPAAPHLPFDAPSKRFDNFDNGVPSLDGNYTGRYKNQLLYMDWIITSLIDELKKQGLLERTLVVITNDHGEMLGEEDGCLGHGWRLAPELCNTPLILMDPRQPGYRLNPTLGSQIDLMPTLLDRLGIPLPAGELYEGVSLFSDEARQERPIYLLSYRQRALVRGHQYIKEDRGLEKEGQVRVYDMKNYGPKTIFTLTDRTKDISKLLDEYEQFQNSLLVHYRTYREFIRERGPQITMAHAK